MRRVVVETSASVRFDVGAHLAFSDKTTDSEIETARREAEQIYKPAPSHAAPTSDSYTVDVQGSPCQREQQDYHEQASN